MRGSRAPGARDEHEAIADGRRLVAEDPAADAQRGAAVGGAAEAARREQEGARRVEVRVAGGVAVGAPAARPARGEEAVVALEVALGPAPDGREPLAVA